MINDTKLHTPIPVFHCGIYVISLELNLFIILTFYTYMYKVPTTFFAHGMLKLKKILGSQ